MTAAEPAEPATMPMPLPAGRAAWVERAAAAIIAALAVTGTAPVAWWLGAETAARR